MKLTVCQLDANQLDVEWAALSTHLDDNPSDLLLLPEMPFSPWFAASQQVDVAIWDEAVEQHQAWITRFAELGVTTITGTMPINQDGKRLNAGFVWTAKQGLTLAHNKTYLPDEETFWEASWYDRGAVDFQSVTVKGVCVGFQICTELWFMQHAREYGQQGIHLLLAPRSTLAASVDKWIVGGRAAAVISGAYCLSSNHVGDALGTPLGGKGWIIDPDGNVLALTSEEQPFVTVEIDLRLAEAAKAEYPRYVDDSPMSTG